VALSDLLAVLRRSWLISLLSFVVVLGVSAGVAFLPATSYSASVKVLVVPKNSATAGNDVQVLQFVVSALPAVIESQDFHERVSRSVPVSQSSAPVTVSGSSNQTTGQLTVEVTSPDRAAVVPWANEAATTVSGPAGGPVTASANLVILNLAHTPTSSANERPLVLAGGAILGLIFALLVPLQVDRSRRRSNRIDYLQQRFDIAVLGTVPTFHPGSGWPIPAVYEANTEGQEVRAVFEAIRLSLVMSLRRRKAPAITVLSASPGEGTSAVVAGLAWSLATSGSQVLAVDYNSTNPSLRELLGGPVADERGSLITATSVLSTAWPELKLAFGSSGLRRAERRRQQFDDGSDQTSDRPSMVLVDGSALGRSAEASAAALATQAVILVADARHRSAKEIGHTLTQLRLLGVEVLGVVLNHASPDGRRSRRRPRRQVAPVSPTHPSSPPVTASASGASRTAPVRSAPARRQARRRRRAFRNSRPPRATGPRS
jgi:capsular polysaccharide biosynthesis protein